MILKRPMTIFLMLILGIVALAWPGAAAHDQATPSGMHDATPMAHMGNTGSGAAYLQIGNASESPDRLLAGATDVAQVVEIHTMEMDDDVMVMIPLPDGLEIPADSTVALEPGGFHVMLINLTQNLNPGDTFELKLTFEVAGDVDVTVTVATDAPENGDSVAAGDLTLSPVWARPAPMLSPVGQVGTPEATPGT